MGRTPWSAADALVGLCEQEQEAGQGAGCGPGGAPHQASILLVISSRFVRSDRIVKAPGYRHRPRYRATDNHCVSSRGKRGTRLLRCVDHSFRNDGNRRAVN